MSNVSLVTKCFIIDTDRRLLVLKRSDAARIRPGEWDLPGGLVDEHEDPNSAVRRELAEETGISASPSIVFISTEYTPAYILTFFYTANYSGDPIEISHEHSAFQWVDMAQFVDLGLPEKFSQAASHLPSSS